MNHTSLHQPAVLPSKSDRIPEGSRGTFIVLGSRAAREWFPDFRSPKDWDVVAAPDAIGFWAGRNRENIQSLERKNDRKVRAKLRGGPQIEFEILGSSPSTLMLAEMARAGLFRPCPIMGKGVGLAASPNVLWMTKRSHAYWSIHWDKTMADLHWLKARTAAPPTPEEQAYFAARTAEHTSRFGERRAYLNQSNDDFFRKSAKAVGRTVEHDQLHEWVAYGERPLFERFKKDLSKAMLSRALFEQAPLQDRLRLVREEAMVIALERYIIPSETPVDPAVAYASALKRICTTLTSGWFRDFAIDNWPLLNIPDKDFAPEVLRRLAA